MGGFGSGRPGYGYPKAEHMKRLDIASLERRGYLRGGPYRYSWSCGDEPMGSITIIAMFVRLPIASPSAVSSAFETSRRNDTPHGRACLGIRVRVCRITEIPIFGWARPSPTQLKRRGRYCRIFSSF
jgi:hypothetical protein